nr:MAG TPA: hypothetical protein [Caudoviricetes sp.]
MLFSIKNVTTECYYVTECYQNVTKNVTAINPVNTYIYSTYYI